MQEFVTIPTYLIRELSPDKLYSLMDFLSMADKSGEIKMSTQEFMKRWNWGNTKVRNFIDYLIDKDICKPKTNQETNQKQTRVFVVNTDFFILQKTKNKPRNKLKTNQEKDTGDKEIYKRIIDYLNSRCGTMYTENNKHTKEIIHARLEEKFTEEDFYTVIDKKCNEWIGTKMERYLRPQTLFGTKFESYLNQNIVKDEKHTGNAYIDTIKNRVSTVDDW